MIRVSILLETMAGLQAERERKSDFVLGETIPIARICDGSTFARCGLHFDFETGAFLSRDKRLGEAIIDDSFRVRIPVNLSADSCRDSGEVAGCQSAVVTENVGDRFGAVGNRVKKIRDVFGKFAALVGFFDGALR